MSRPCGILGSFPLIPELLSLNQSCGKDRHSVFCCKVKTCHPGEERGILCHGKKKLFPQVEEKVKGIPLTLKSAAFYPQNTLSEI